MPFSIEELNSRRTKLIQHLTRLGKKGIVIIPSRDGFSYGETFRQLNDFYYFTGLELPNSLLVLDLNTGLAAAYVPEMDLRFENGSRPNDFPGRPLLLDVEIQSRSGLVLRSVDLVDSVLAIIEQSDQVVLVNGGRPGPIPLSSSSSYVTTFSPVQIMMKAMKSKFPDLEFENIYGSIASLRMLKSSTEIALMRRSVDITVQGIMEAAKHIKPGVEERYLEGILEGSYKLKGSHRLAFGSIVKSGPNSLWPWRILATHYNRRNRSMQSGELVIFDVGCEYQHYVSDVGRTFPVSGKFSERQKEILITETSIADQIIEYIRPGITFHDIKELTDSIIPDDFKEYMQVGLFFGHHLGLSTGDPNLSNATLQPGMIFTVEPWYYNHHEQIAVFTEDVILVTVDGCEVLSEKLPRTPEGLETLVRSP